MSQSTKPCTRTDFAGKTSKALLVNHLQGFHADRMPVFLGKPIPTTALGITFIRQQFNEAHAANRNIEGLHYSAERCVVCGKTYTTWSCDHEVQS